MFNTVAARGMEEVIADPRLLDVAVPAFNGHFDAVSLGGMYAMLAGGGQLGGVRILSEDTVRKASEVQNNRRDRIIVMTMQWRLGYHRTPILSRQLPRAYGHFGFGGSGAGPIPSTTWRWRWSATVGEAHPSAMRGYFASVRPPPASPVRHRCWRLRVDHGSGTTTLPRL